MTPAWILGLVLAVATLPGAVAQETPAASTAPSKDEKPPARPAPPPAHFAVRPPSVTPALGGAPGVSVSSGAPAQPRPVTSPWEAEMVKLARAGVEENVLLAFIDSAGTFNLNTDQIIYLRDLGLPSEVISAMLQHDAELIVGLRQMPAGGVALSTPGPTLTLLPAAKPVTEKLPTPAPSAASSSATAASPGKTPTATPKPTAPAPAGGVEVAQAPPLGAESVPLFEEEEEAATEPEPLYRVREPYPVQLTDPIVNFRTEGRVPNRIFIRLFP